MKTFDLKMENTLAGAAARPNARAEMLVFAVIVDATEMIKRESGENFVTRLKIVDPTLNYKTEVKNTGLKFFKFCHVNVYTETPETGIKVQNIGDIIRLRRFKFVIGEKGELCAYEQTAFSNWMIYSGERNSDYECIGYKCNFAKNINRVANKYERGRINDLREWAYNFFSTSSLRYIVWWNDIVNATPSGSSNKNMLEYEKVDLILKVTGSNPRDRSVQFIDSEDNKYNLVLPAPLNATKNQVMKLRCVNVSCPQGKKDGVRQLHPTELSSSLYLRNYYRDALCFDTEKRKLVGKNFYLLEFNCDKKTPFITDIKKLHNGLKKTSLSALAQLFGKEPAMHQSEKFLVEARVAGFVTVAPQSIVFKQIDKFESPVALSMKTEQKYQVIYHVGIKLHDESSKEGLTAYLTTSADNYYVFDAWKLLPPTKDNVAWDAIKPAQLTAFSNKLSEMTKKNCRVRLVLQLLMTRAGKPFLKIIDTLFHEF